jgi:hypothetical protein
VSRWNKAADERQKAAASVPDKVEDAEPAPKVSVRSRLRQER